MAIAADSGALNIIRIVTPSFEDEEWSFDERIAPQRLNIALGCRVSSALPERREHATGSSPRHRQELSLLPARILAPRSPL